jgi:serine/threonine protein kinase
MDGGKYVSSGSFGCTFRRPVKCKGELTRKQLNHSNGNIGKVFYDKDEAEAEYKLYKIVRKIDQSGTFTLPLHKKCNVLNFERADEVDKCDLNLEESRSNLVQLVYKYGGQDLYGYIDDHMQRGKLQGSFMKVFRAMGPVFSGLQRLNKAGWFHLDLKPGNILFDGKRVFVIDFGLMEKGSKVYRMDNVRKLGFDYLYYPPELKMYVTMAEKKSLATLQNQFARNFLNGSVSLAEFDKFIGMKSKDCIEGFYLQHQNKARQRQQSSLKYFNTLMCEKVDVYGLGITLMELFIYLVPNPDIEHYAIQQFIARMVNPNAYMRYGWDELIENYEVIMDKCKKN